MKCETLQFNLPLFSEDELNPDELAGLKNHLVKCPVCRSKHAEFLALKNDLRILARPQMPMDLMNLVKNAVRKESNQLQRNQNSIFSENTWEWLQFRVMPYSVGTVLSVILTISFLYTLIITQNGANKMNQELAANNSKGVVLLPPDQIAPTDQIVWTKESYAALRVPVSMESPSLNPKGALIALTKSVVRGNMKDEEITVVADVFSTGLAQIAQIVEVPRGNDSMSKIENALQNEPNEAPFVPSNLDKRSDDIRVVFKIIWVDVDKKPEIKKSSKK